MPVEGGLASKLLVQYRWKIEFSQDQVGELNGDTYGGCAGWENDK